MQKIILTLGIPGSGKTYWSEAFVDASDGKVVNINRDDLRWMLNNYKFTKEVEELITETRDYLTELALAQGKDVIWSDTNLNPKNRKQAAVVAAKAGNVEVVIKDFTQVPLATCIERNAKRPHPVPERVIHQMYNTYVRVKENENSLTPAIICDLDGTLANCDHRSPYDFKACYDDTVIKNVLQTLKAFWPAYARIIFITGRQERSRAETVAWLKDKCGIDFGYDLYMAKDNDRESSVIFKTEVYEKHIKDKFDVMFVLEDRNKQVKKWRELGLPCWQVADGDF